MDVVVILHIRLITGKVLLEENIPNIRAPDQLK